MANNALTIYFQTHKLMRKFLNESATSQPNFNHSFPKNSQKCYDWLCQNSN